MIFIFWYFAMVQLYKIREDFSVIIHKNKNVSNVSNLISLIIFTSL